MRILGYRQITCQESSRELELINSDSGIAATLDSVSSLPIEREACMPSIPNHNFKQMANSSLQPPFTILQASPVRILSLLILSDCYKEALAPVKTLDKLFAVSAANSLHKAH